MLDEILKNAGIKNFDGLSIKVQLANGPTVNVPAHMASTINISGPSIQGFDPNAASNTQTVTTVNKLNKLINLELNQRRCWLEHHPFSTAKHIVKRVLDPNFRQLAKYPDEPKFVKEDQVFSMDAQVTILSDLQIKERVQYLYDDNQYKTTTNRVQCLSMKKFKDIKQPFFARLIKLAPFGRTNDYFITRSNESKSICLELGSCSKNTTQKNQASHEPSDQCYCGKNLKVRMNISYLEGENLGSSIDPDIFKKYLEEASKLKCLDKILYLVFRQNHMMAQAKKVDSVRPMIFDNLCEYLKPYLHSMVEQNKFPEAVQILQFNPSAKGHRFHPKFLKAQIQLAIKYDLFVENYAEYQKCDELTKQEAVTLHKNQIQYIKDANQYKALIDFLGQKHGGIDRYQFPWMNNTICKDILVPGLGFGSQNIFEYDQNFEISLTIFSQDTWQTVIMENNGYHQLCLDESVNAIKCFQTNTDLPKDVKGIKMPSIQRNQLEDWMVPMVHSMKLYESSVYYVYNTIYCQKMKKFLEKQTNGNVPLDGKPKILLISVKFHEDHIVECNNTKNREFIILDNMRDVGNALYRQKRYDQAHFCYFNCIQLIKKTNQTKCGHYRCLTKNEQVLLNFNYVELENKCEQNLAQVYLNQDETNSHNFNPEKAIQLLTSLINQDKVLQSIKNNLDKFITVNQLNTVVANLGQSSSFPSHKTFFMRAKANSMILAKLRKVKIDQVTENLAESQKQLISQRFLKSKNDIENAHKMIIQSKAGTKFEQDSIRDLKDEILATRGFFEGGKQQDKTLLELTQSGIQLQLQPMQVLYKKPDNKEVQQGINDQTKDVKTEIKIQRLFRPETTPKFNESDFDPQTWYAPCKLDENGELLISKGQVEQKTNGPEISSSSEQQKLKNQKERQRKKMRKQEKVEKEALNQYIDEVMKKEPDAKIDEKVIEQLTQSIKQKAKRKYGKDQIDDIFNKRDSVAQVNQDDLKQLKTPHGQDTLNQLKEDQKIQKKQQQSQDELNEKTDQVEEEKAVSEEKNQSTSSLVIMNPQDLTLQESDPNKCFEEEKESAVPSKQALDQVCEPEIFKVLDNFEKPAKKEESLANHDSDDEFEDAENNCSDDDEEVTVEEFLETKKGEINSVLKFLISQKSFDKNNVDKFKSSKSKRDKLQMRAYDKFQDKFIKSFEKEEDIKDELQLEEYLELFLQKYAQRIINLVIT